jgi:hypothetical protein
VRGRAGVTQRADPGGDGRAASDDRASTLELVDRQVHAVPEQSGERALHAVLAHQLLEISVLATRLSEELAIRTRGPRVDDVACELQEIVGPMLEAVPKRRTRLGERDGPAQEAREAREKTRPSDRVAAPAHAPGRLSRSRR